jgi:hypothetical protein
MPEKGQQFRYIEENLMDRLDERRRNSGIRLHYGTADRDWSGGYTHELYATHGSSSDIIGHISWKPNSGKVDLLDVHPDWQHTIVAHTLLKAANDLQMRFNPKGHGLGPSYETSDSGHRIIKKFLPNHDYVTPEYREPVEDFDDKYATLERFKRLNIDGDLNFKCWDCDGSGLENPNDAFGKVCSRCDGQGYETPFSTPVEKVLKWE